MTLKTWYQRLTIHLVLCIKGYTAQNAQLHIHFDADVLLLWMNGWLTESVLAPDWLFSYYLRIQLNVLGCPFKNMRDLTPLPAPGFDAHVVGAEYWVEWKAGFAVAWLWFNNNNNNNNHDNIYSAVIIAEPLREFTRFTRWIQKRCQVAADLGTKPIGLSRRPACMAAVKLYPPSPFVWKIWVTDSLVFIVVDDHESNSAS